MFMLTDPVTSPTSNYGKAMIGIIAAFVVLIIRTQTALPQHRCHERTSVCR
jgi:Na+-translocating ferredoxin:NAD+ oxidoreductase RnfD subunit